MSKIRNVDLERAVSRDPRQVQRNNNSRNRKLGRLVRRQHNWDYGELYELIAKKLECMLDYAKTDSVGYYQDWHPEWIIRAINLGNHLAGKYKYPQHINTNNMSRFADTEYLGKYAGENRWAQEEVYNIKAKYLFFEIMKNYIENWWD